MNVSASAVANITVAAPKSGSYLRAARRADIAIGGRFGFARRRSRQVYGRLDRSGRLRGVFLRDDVRLEFIFLRLHGLVGGFFLGFRLYGLSCGLGCGLGGFGAGFLFGGFWFGLARDRLFLASRRLFFTSYRFAGVIRLGKARCGGGLGFLFGASVGGGAPGPGPGILGAGDQCAQATTGCALGRRR